MRFYLSRTPPRSLSDEILVNRLRQVCLRLRSGRLYCSTQTHSSNTALPKNKIAAANTAYTYTPALGCMNQRFPKGGDCSCVAFVFSDTIAERREKGLNEGIYSESCILIAVGSNKKLIFIEIQSHTRICGREISHM